MSSFEDRKKNFENKFAHDEELKFKVNSKRNKSVSYTHLTLPTIVSV